MPLLALASLLTILPLTHAANHDIHVGPSLTFTPNSTFASTGDTLTFHFYPGKHNVASSTFSTPCAPPPNGGFYSGFIVPEKGEDRTTFVVTVNGTEPIWYYCTEVMHCQLGTVGIVNPPTSGETLEAYALAASETTESTTPTEVAGGVLSVLGSSPSTSTSSIPSPSSGPSLSSLTTTISKTMVAPTIRTTAPTPAHSLSAGVVLTAPGDSNVLLHGIGALVAVAAFWAGLI